MDILSSVKCEYTHRKDNIKIPNKIQIAYMNNTEIINPNDLIYLMYCDHSPIKNINVPEYLLYLNLAWISICNINNLMYLSVYMGNIPKEGFSKYLIFLDACYNKCIETPPYLVYIINFVYNQIFSISQNLMYMELEGVEIHNLVNHNRFPQYTICCLRDWPVYGAYISKYTSLVYYKYK
jgi:hypothetical protein